MSCHTITEACTWSLVYFLTLRHIRCAEVGHAPILDVLLIFTALQMVLETKASMESGVIGAGHRFATTRLDAAAQHSGLGEGADGRHLVPLLHPQAGSAHRIGVGQRQGRVLCHSVLCSEGCQSGMDMKQHAASQDKACKSPELAYMAPDVISLIGVLTAICHIIDGCS